MFDPKAFNKDQFIPRTATVAVPALAAYFKNDEKAEFEVRGLTGAELARCNTAAAKRDAITVVANSFSIDDESKAQLKNLLGDTDKLPAEIVRRTEMLDINFPNVGLPTWVKLAQAFPVVFYELTNKILELTGQGGVVAKPQPSGTIAESEI